MLRFNIYNLLIIISFLAFTGCGEDVEEYVLESDAIYNANAATPLTFTNYLGNAENIHPKVLYFDKGWRGYEFWMAYTPYPLGKTDAENPCIAVSHDGIDWFCPPQLQNPLAFAPKDGYNSDTHLVYNEERDELEVWYRPYDIPSATDGIVRRISSDGVNWSEVETVFPTHTDKGMRLSPAVWIENGIYRLVYSNANDLYLTEGTMSKDGWIWSEPQTLDVNWGDLSPWHQDIIPDGFGGYHLVVCCYLPGENNNSADLYYVHLNSELKGDWEPAMILARGRYKDDFDKRSIYRSSLVRVGGMFYLYYSCIDNRWHRYLALSRGKNLFNLIGYGKELDTGGQ